VESSVNCDNKCSVCSMYSFKVSTDFNFHNITI
jgi:hypothetical protein